jgi:hypothetical protein
MGLQLPGELASLLNDMGYTWPMVDEEKLFDLGQHWLSHAGTLEGIHADAVAVATRAWTDNRGDAIDGFTAQWNNQDSAAAVLQDGVTAAQVVGACLFVCAAIVLALKINVIVQLTILLIEIIEAIASAPPTFGASLLEIPVFKKLTDIAVNLIISMAMEAILG